MYDEGRVRNRSGNLTWLVKRSVVNAEGIES